MPSKSYFGRNVELALLMSGAQKILRIFCCTPAVVFASGGWWLEELYAVAHSIDTFSENRKLNSNEQTRGQRIKHLRRKKKKIQFRRFEIKGPPTVHQKCFSQKMVYRGVTVDRGTRH